MCSWGSPRLSCHPAAPTQMSACILFRAIAALCSLPLSSVLPRNSQQRGRWPILCPLAVRKARSGIAQLAPSWLLFPAASKPIGLEVKLQSDKRCENKAPLLARPAKQRGSGGKFRLCSWRDTLSISEVVFWEQGAGKFSDQWPLESPVKLRLYPISLRELGALPLATHQFCFLFLSERMA